MKNNPKYLQFPLCLLQEIQSETKNTISNMILYGIWYYSQNQIKVTVQDACRQYIYDYCRNKKALCTDLISFMDSFSEKIPLDDNELFDLEGNFDPIDACFDLCNILIDYPDIQQKVIEHLQWQRATNFYGEKGLYSNKGLDEIEKFKSEHEIMHGKQPMPSINIKLLLSFKNNPINIELLMAFIAIKSLIGRNKYMVTNKKTIVMRMIGAKSNNALEYALLKSELKTIYNKYITRYHFDNLIDELLKRNFISSKIGLGRKLYISTVLDYEKLQAEVVHFRKERDFKRKEKQAREFILQKSS